MSAISQRDYQGVLACVRRLQECESLEEFPLLALTEIPRLVGADHSTFNYVAPSVPRVIVSAFPEVSDHERRQRVFSRYVSDHPVLNHYLATGDGTAYKISDFQSVREYHALPLYEHFYHELRYEDQFAFELFKPGAELISMALARDRRSFTERDRQVLNLLRPHVAAAYRQTEQITLLKRSLHPGKHHHLEVRVTSILLNTDNRPVQYGIQARQWMHRFFPGHSDASARLPAPVREWLRRISSREHRGPVSAPQDNSLVREYQGERLRIRVLAAPSGNSRMLVLGLETNPSTARSSRAGRLTHREIEVLLQVEHGKTNDEVGAALGISALTVRTHLEHIFEKLRVPSRTAAVTRFRRLCSDEAR